MPYDAKKGTMVKLRSQIWFDNPDDPDMTALYIERYMNWGISRKELQSGKPIIGIAQTGSDLSPCNRHHLVLAQRVREGIREAGGIAFEFPVHPIQETGKRPTAALDRNLAYLGLVETLFGWRNNFYDLGIVAHFWASEYSSDNAYVRILSNDKSAIHIIDSNKSAYRSVRCVKDN